MKIRINDGREYEVEQEILEYISLKYGMQLLEQYEKLDSTVQFGLKIVSKKMLKELLGAFEVSAKLPRGTDPTIFLLRAYITIALESMKRTQLTLYADEATGSIYHQQMNLEQMATFGPIVAGYLENLKHYGSTAERVDDAGASGLPEPDLHRTGTELAASGQETEWQDDGGQAPDGIPLPTVS